MVIAFLDGVFHVTAVGGNTGKTEETALLVHVVIHFVGGVAFFFHDVGNDCGVDIAAACAHFNACEGSEAHGGIDALAALDSGDRGTVAHVAGDDLGFFCGLAEHLSRFHGNVAVGGAVEAVAADAVFFSYVVGNGVGVSIVGHGLMENSIENDRLGNVRHNFLAALDTHDGGACVERSDLAATLEFFHSAFFKECIAVEINAAVNCAVTDGIDLTHILDATELGIGEGVNDDLHGNCVVGHGKLANGFGAVFLFVFNKSVDADSFAKTFCENVFCGGVEELILERRAACINDQYVHDLFSSV